MGLTDKPTGRGMCMSYTPEVTYEVKRYSSDQGEMLIGISVGVGGSPGGLYSGKWLCSLTYEGVVIIDRLPQHYWTRHTHHQMAIIAASYIMANEPWSLLPDIVGNRERIHMWISNTIKELSHE